MEIKLSKEQWLGIARHSLTCVGGILIAKGLVDGALWAEISGAALTLVGGVWSVVVKA
jgi:hypothetical protein